MFKTFLIFPFLQLLFQLGRTLLIPSNFVTKHILEVRLIIQQTLLLNTHQLLALELRRDSLLH